MGRTDQRHTNYDASVDRDEVEEVSPPRPKQEYQEREPDEEGTPFERFQRLVSRVMPISKDEIDRRETDSDDRLKRCP